MNRLHITIEHMSPSDLDAVLGLLRESRLPPDGLIDRPTDIQVARADGRIVGCVALEIYVDGALLRSLAVSGDHRGTGLGIRLTEAALQAARRAGSRAVYLLTETATEFFPRFGFRSIQRRQVPPGVSTSIEFTSVCPDTAVAMVVELDERRSRRSRTMV